MPSYVWRQKPPTLQEVIDAGGSAHYWARGWNFNRPVMAEVSVATRAAPPENYVNVVTVGGQAIDEPATSPRFTNHEMLPGWAPLEWAGPIAKPSGKRAQSQPRQPISIKERPIKEK
ncbi:hypothetical protein ACT3OH_01700 [Vreelandella zhanjiangensis]|uniref:hypothetical protein n=1 Tax=Vreelandella zhanjiangensis TaxID=1121960 RepID=UPI00402AFDA3